MNSIPLEIFHDIFCRFSVKSIGRCRCVSEQWRSILCSSDFTELFSTKSSTRPSLLFAMETSTNNEFLFLSSPQLDDKSSSLPASVQFKLSKDIPLKLCGHASGLFCLRRMPISNDLRDEKEEYTEHVICNPSRGQYGFLPKLRTGPKSFLGFDPIDKVFKVVSSNSTFSSCSKVLNIFTLGTGEIIWRKIKSPVAHYPWSKGICIDGVLYYLAQGNNGRSFFLVCFDVRSEEFNFMYAKFIHGSTLINYEGKLGLTKRPRPESLTMWVLEDAEKHDWSELTFTLSIDKFGGIDVYVAGVSTATCEIVLVSYYYDHSTPFYVFYFHPERDTVRRLEVQGFENLGGDRVYPFVDHVDDLTFNMKSWQLHQDVPPRFESINKFRALSLLDDV